VRNVLRQLRLHRTVGILAALGFALLIASGDVFQAAPTGLTKAFLIVRSDSGYYYGGKFEEDCPQGYEMTVEEAFLATQTPAERERLLRPENAREYASKWKNDFIMGPGGENVCNNPKSFLNDPRHPPYRGVQGKVAYGMNLDGTPDGRATAKTCGHQKFTSVNGEPSVDNQLFRAMGCAKARASAGAGGGEGGDPYLIEIRGINDPKSDDHVEVGIYSTDDVPLKGSDGKTLPNQTLGVTANPRWRMTVAGRIVDGQVMTEVIPVYYTKWVLPTWGVFGLQDHEYRDARFRMSLQADGTLKGMMASYRPIDNIFTVGECCKGTASTANTDCASVRKTVVMMADGYPDPETGQCTTISSATNFVGIPVFLTHKGEMLSRASAR
jgi:hypothetical protein